MFFMMKAFYFLVSFSIVFLMSSCEPSKEDAVQYNNSIVEIETRAEVSINTFFENFNADNPDNNIVVQKTIAAIQQCKKDLQAVPDIEGGADFKAKGMEMFVTYEQFFQKDVAKWLTALGDPQRTEESLVAAQKEFQAAKERALVSQAQFEKAQTEFASRYGFELK